MQPLATDLTAELVTALLHEQHPDLAGLPVTFGASGWDNQLWRLGEELAVRLPWATDDASALLMKELDLVPEVGADLPLPTPVPQRLGEPSELYPQPWIVTTWVPGEPADRAPATRAEDAADRLAEFLVALHRPAPANAPRGRHGRGGPLADSAAGFEYFLGDAMDRGLVPDPVAARAVWQEALAAPAWTGPATWLHADLHAANLLTAEGTFCGVVDFGDLCAGDPALDLAGGWLVLPDGALDRFLAAYGPPDTALVLRARAWALAKAVACLIIADDGAKGLHGGKVSWGPPAAAALRRLTA